MNKDGLFSFEEVYEAVKKKSEGNFDRRINLEDFKADTPNRIICSKNNNVVHLTKTSKRQLLYHLGFRSDFYEDSESLQVDRLNYRLKVKGKREYLFRMHRNGKYSLRGMLTTHKYQKYDAIDILEDTYKLLGNKVNKMVFDSNITSNACPDEFRLIIINKNIVSKIREIKQYIAFSDGVSIFTSEIGKLSMYIYKMFVRLSCKNGMVFKGNQEENKHRHSLGVIDWFKKKFMTIFNSEFTEDFTQIYTKLEDKKLETEEKIIKFIISALKDFGIPYTKHTDNILKIYNIKYPFYNVQSVLNALTDYGHSLGVNGRFKIELGTGNWLTNPNTLDRVLINSKRLELNNEKKEEGICRIMK